MQQFEVDLGTNQKRELQQVVDFYDKNWVFFSLSLSIAKKSAGTATSMMIVSQFFWSTKKSDFVTSITII